jgi:hypothetical protein
MFPRLGTQQFASSAIEINNNAFVQTNEYRLILTSTLAEVLVEGDAVNKQMSAGAQDCGISRNP